MIGVRIRNFDHVSQQHFGADEIRSPDPEFRTDPLNVVKDLQRINRPAKTLHQVPPLCRHRTKQVEHGV